MPKRFIGEETRYSKTLAKLSNGAERMLWRLITVADDFGRFRAEPEILKSDCFPVMVRVSVQETLKRFEELKRAEIVIEYEVDGIRYGLFPKFNLPKHQGPARATKSKLPAPPSDLKISVNGCFHLKTVVPLSVSVSDPVSEHEFDSIPPITANTKREESSPHWEPEEEWLPKFLESQRLVEFTRVELDALMDPQWWNRTSIACNGIEAPFLERELAKMGNWLGSHKSRRPTKKFIQNWLVKAGTPQ